MLTYRRSYLINVCEAVYFSDRLVFNPKFYAVKTAWNTVIDSWALLAAGWKLDMKSLLISLYYWALVPDDVTSTRWEPWLHVCTEGGRKVVSLFISMFDTHTRACMRAHVSTRIRSSINISADGVFPTRFSGMLPLTSGFSMSVGMQRCHWNLSASCLWHSCSFWSPLKHRAALCPLWWGGGVANMGLCFRLAWQPNNTRSPMDWSRMLRAEGLYFRWIFADFYKLLGADRRLC